MKTLFRFCLVILVVLVLTAAQVAPPACASGILTYAASKTLVDGGERFVLSVNVDATPNLYGVQLSLKYDNTRLTVVEVRNGDVWPAGKTFSSSSFSNGGTGDENVQFYATLTDETLTVPAGTLMTVLFEAVNPASQVTTQIEDGTALSLILADRNGQPIAAAAPAPVTITIDPSPTVSGVVTLQSPGTNRPVTVDIRDQSIQKNTSVASGAPFALQVPSGSSYVLTARADCHLSARLTGVASPSTGHTTTLTAGDVNGDDRINIIDLAAIALHIGQSGVSGCSNLNGDGAGNVNILDLVLPAINFGKSGPTVW